MKYKHTKYSNMVFLCKNCGKDITHKPSNRRIFCNSNCCNDWQRKTHYDSKFETRQCLECKKDFICKPHETKKFCCHSCSAKYTNRDRAANHSEVFLKISLSCKKSYKQGKMSGLQKGVDLAKRKAKKVNKVCPICGKKYKISLYKEKAGVGKYCSKECSYKRPGQGGYHAGSVRNYKSGWYTSPIAGVVWLDSSYEFIMAEYLDNKKYKWIKNTKGFPYKKIDKDGTERDANYIPDFYIEDLDLWVETKGYMVENDKRKMDAFPCKIKLISKKIIYDKSSWGF